MKLAGIVRKVAETGLVDFLGPRWRAALTPSVEPCCTNGVILRDEFVQGEWLPKAVKERSR